MIQEVTVALEVGTNVPVWDIKIPTLRGKPAPVRTMFFNVEPSPIQGGKPKLLVGLVVAVDPTEPKVTRRFCLLAPSGKLTDRLHDAATWIATAEHPSGFYASMYEFDIALTDAINNEEETAEAAQKASTSVTPHNPLDVLKSFATDKETP